MQIHEITEGLFSNVARGFASGITGVDIPQSQASIDRQAAQAAEKLRAQGYGQAPATGATERITVAISQPGQNVPANYFKTRNVWTNELGAVITDPKQKAYLDGLIPTHGKKQTITQPTTAQQPTRRVSRARVPRGRTVKTK